MKTFERRRILVVEDEMTIALMIEDMLEELGHEVVGTAMRLDQALRLAESAQVDLAILDVNLDGKSAFPIADILAARNISFFFATGYGTQILNKTYGDALTLQKPFQLADLAETIRMACTQKIRANDTTGAKIVEEQRPRTPA